MPTRMDETPDRWFARFQKTGDADALARVFDATAPRLLRIAIHFAGDVSAAEDLVQATFVTAIERASTFDETRALEPWLTGILARHARELRRDARRTPDVTRLIERRQETPLEESQAAEFSSALAEALDRVEEPYRQTLVLRLRHGMKSADIAHVLGESPSAVRVRIHRGLEKLRKLLPVGVALSGVVAIESSRGLAAVKQSVLAKAATQVAASSTLVIGGVLVGKKLALSAVAAVLMLAAWWEFSRAKKSELVSPIAAEVVHEPRREPVSRRDGSFDSADEAVSASAERAPAAIEPATNGASVPLRGIVLDGETGAPIAGANVELFTPRTTTLSALKQRWWERIQQYGGTFSSRDTYPWLPNEPSDPARADAETVTVYDPPLPGVAPSAVTNSGADGTFELTATEAWGFLTCEVAGYGKREMTARRNEIIHRIDAKRQSTSASIQHDSVVVRMWKAGRLTGSLIDPQGERVRRHLKLCFFGRCPKTSPVEGSAYDPSTIGSWLIETDADGNFDAELAAPSVNVCCVDAGWTLVNIGFHPTRKEDYVFETSFEPGKQSEPAWLVVRRMTVLSVVDATTRKPIESVQLVIRERGDGYPQFAGKLHAPRGKLCLVSNPNAFQSSERWQRPCHLTVWAEGYSAVELDVDDPLEGPDVEVGLPRGEVPLVHGIVRSAGHPVEGCIVSALAFSGMSWSIDDGFVANSARSKRDGAFELRLPAGKYLLRCRLGDLVRCLTFQAPTQDPLVMDLDRGGSITVRLRDADGSPRAGHRAAIHGSDGRSQGGETDAKGELTIPLLPPGNYTAFIPFQSRGASFSADAQETFDLAEDEKRTVEFRLPASDPRHARLVLDDGESCDGWRARSPYGAATEWVAVQADGTIPIDIQVGVQTLELEQRERRRWSFSIPKNPPDGFPLRISRRGRGFKGVLRDESDGHPLGGVCVLAVHWLKDFEVTRCTACTTDADGAFEVRGLEEAEYELSFRGGGWESSHWDRSLGYVTFLPFQLPADPPIALDVRVPPPSLQGSRESGSISLSGKVRLLSAPEMRPNVRVVSLIDLPEGTLRLLTSKCQSDIDADGSYRLVVPRADRYRASFYDWKARHEFPAQEWNSSSNDAEQTRDFELK